MRRWPYWGVADPTGPTGEGWEHVGKCGENHGRSPETIWKYMEL